LRARFFIWAKKCGMTSVLSEMFWASWTSDFFCNRCNFLHFQSGKKIIWDWNWHGNRISALIKPPEIFFTMGLYSERSRRSKKFISVIIRWRQLSSKQTTVDRFWRPKRWTKDGCTNRFMDQFLGHPVAKDREQQTSWSFHSFIYKERKTLNAWPPSCEDSFTAQCKLSYVRSSEKGIVPLSN